MPLIRDLARHPGMCPDWESNWQPFGSQALNPLSAGTQSTDPHQPGLGRFFQVGLYIACAYVFSYFI